MGKLHGNCDGWPRVAPSRISSKGALTRFNSPLDGIILLLSRRHGCVA